MDKTARNALPALLNELPTMRNRAYLCACRPNGGKNSLAPLFKIFSNAWRSAFASLEIQISRQRWSSDSTEHCASAHGDIFHIETPSATLMFYKKLCRRTIRPCTVVHECGPQRLTFTKLRVRDKTWTNAGAPIIVAATAPGLIVNLTMATTSASVEQRTPSSKDTKKVSARRFSR